MQEDLITFNDADEDALRRFFARLTLGAEAAATAEREAAGQGERKQGEEEKEKEEQEPEADSKLPAAGGEATPMEVEGEPWLLSLAQQPGLQQVLTCQVCLCPVVTAEQGAASSAQQAAAPAVAVPSVATPRLEFSRQSATLQDVRGSKVS